MTRTHRPRRLARIAAALIACALSITVPTSRASAGAVGDAAAEAGLGLAAGMLTVLYVPLKVAVASTGFLVGGSAWLVTGFDPQPAHSILRTTAGGDWLVTQDHLRGRDDFAILGKRSGDVAARSSRARR